MKTLNWRHTVGRRVAKMALLLLVPAFLQAGGAFAEDCGGPLSGSTGNVVGSIAGAVGGGLLGSQFGGGAGKGVLTGLGVVGGALAGGYVGRQAEGCRRPAAQAATGSAARACRFVSNPAVIDGQTQQVEGVACREQDGVWRIATGPAADQAAGADLVLRAQQRLHDQGFYVRNNVDGRWGPATSTAVRNFQRTNGMAPTGQLDAPTKTALGLDPVPFTELAQGNPPAPGNPPAQPDAQPTAATPVATEPSSIYK